MILLIDNYDSFSYNLYQMLGALSPDIRVVRNDALTVEDVRTLSPRGIVLSPGPGRPEDAGICMEAAGTLGETFPILGVCLGHQAICQAFGGVVSYAKTLMHGKQSLTRIDPSDPLFRGLPEEIPVARYHSLSLREETLPDCLLVTARADDGEVMAVRHREWNVHGLQFHPESILTPDGRQILQNWIRMIGADGTE